MSEWTSDFIISICVIIGMMIIKLLPKKIKWGWRLVIGMTAAIALSITGHLIVKAFNQNFC